MSNSFPIISNFSSTFNFGMGFGKILGILEAFNISYNLVTLLNDAPFLAGHSTMLKPNVQNILNDSKHKQIVNELNEWKDDRDE